MVQKSLKHLFYGNLNKERAIGGITSGTTVIGVGLYICLTVTPNKNKTNTDRHPFESTHQGGCIVCVWGGVLLPNYAFLFRIQVLSSPPTSYHVCQDKYTHTHTNTLYGGGEGEQEKEATWAKFWAIQFNAAHLCLKPLPESSTPKPPTREDQVCHFSVLSQQGSTKAFYILASFLS